MNSKVLTRRLFIQKIQCGFAAILTMLRCLLIQRHFCAVYDYAGKADLSKGLLESKKKIWGYVNTHFSEMIKQ